MHFTSHATPSGLPGFMTHSIRRQSKLTLMRLPVAASTILGLGAFVVCLMNLGVVMLPQHGSTKYETQVIGSFGPSKQETAVQQQDVGPYPEPNPRPILTSIMQGWNITGDPSWLLNFAIVGFPKCGTSTLMYLLESHPEVKIFKDERCELAYNQQVRLIADLYHKIPPGAFARGIKCPMDIESTRLSMRNYEKFFPKSLFIVGIRHPVLWFESFYNFRIHNGFPMPPAESLIGKCRKGYWNVCTFRSNFHVFLSNLGKTNRTDEELALVAPQYQHSLDPVPMPNRRVFLYELSQLQIHGRTAQQKALSAQFRKDLQIFLQLRQPIHSMIWFKPGINHTSDSKRETADANKIDICEDRYDVLRLVLMEQAVNVSRWIRQYFVHSPNVVVSSKDYFVNDLMTSWERDPCVDRVRQRTTLPVQ